MTSEEKIKKWIEGSLSREEEKAFRQSEEFKALQKIIESSRAFAAPGYDVEEELRKLNERKKSKAKGKAVKVSWLRPALQIAASLLIIAIVGYFLIPDEISVIETQAGEKIDFYLPDSSHVILNAKSTISYNEATWNNRRKVTLHGEAFFEVAKGSRFDVRTPAGTVSVLGTRFNVRDRRNFYEVKCFEGLVLVDLKKKQLKLPADHGFSIIDGRITEFESLSSTKPTWIINMSTFKSVPFKKVVEEFERQYDVTVELSEGSAGKLFSGSFIHGDINLALRSITLPLDLRYKIIDQHKVIISSE